MFSNDMLLILMKTLVTYADSREKDRLKIFLLLASREISLTRQIVSSFMINSDFFILIFVFFLLKNLKFSEPAKK